MSYNLPLMKEVLDIITLNPELHDQGTYECAIRVPTGDICDTTRCVAGWAIVRSYPNAQGLKAAAEIHYKDSTTMGAEGDYFTAGMELLGLSEEEAENLFYLDESSAVEALEYILETGTYPEYLEDSPCTCDMCLDD